MFGMFGLTRRRRARLRAKPVPPEWESDLGSDVPYFGCLPPADRRELIGHVRVFLAEKRFEGAAGLEVTQNMRLSIAAQACTLLLHRDTDYYPGLRTIIVYPRGYIATVKRQLPGGVVVEGPEGRLGESWLRGSVVLSWDDAQAGARAPHDGHNVVFHEFAHQLDGESGDMEGAPALASADEYRAWSKVFQREFDALRADLAARRPTLLNPYAATSPPEFFAVAVEFFFERPAELRARHPDLYQQMRLFFRQDPAERFIACYGHGNAEVTE